MRHRGMPLGRSMKGTSLFFITAIIILQLFPISQGQVVPEVEVECDQPAPIDVYPGATRTTIIYCSIQNSNPYSVTVEMTYQGGVLAIAGPGSATGAPGSETEFQVSVRGARAKRAWGCTIWRRRSWNWWVKTRSGIQIQDRSSQP